MRAPGKRRARFGVGLVTIVAALASFTPVRATHGGWDGTVIRPVGVCPDLLRPLSQSATANAGPQDHSTGSIGAYAAAGINAPNTPPPVGVILENNPAPLPPCIGLGASRAVGDSVIRAIIAWPGAPTANRVRVTFSNIQLNPNVPAAIVSPTVPVAGLADAAWRLAVGIQVTHYPCATPSGAAAPPCAADGPLLSDVENVGTSISPILTTVDLCVANALGTTSGSLVVDAVFSTSAVAHGDGHARVAGEGFAAPPVNEFVAGGCGPDDPFDGDSE